MRNNAFIVLSKNMGKKALSHKDFSKDIILWLMLKAQQEQVSATRRLKKTIESSESKEDTNKTVNKKQKVKESTSDLFIFQNSNHADVYQIVYFFRILHCK